MYGRFGSKDELLTEAVIRKVERGALEWDFEGRTVAEVLAEWNRPSGALSDAEATQLEAFVTARRDPEVAASITRARRRWRSTIARDLIGRAIADGTADADGDWDAVVFLMEALSLGLLLQRGAGQEAPDEEAWQRLLNRMIRSIAQSGDQTAATPAD